MTGILTKLEKKSGGDRIALDMPIEITYYESPVIGKSFFFFDTKCKYIQTTPVESIETIYIPDYNDTWIITTKNSIYKLV